MKYNILISTTNSIENAEIEKYFGIVSTNIVVGTNLFADFGASLTDIFGGSSEIYKGKLEKIYKMAIDEIQSKANAIGANAIIGLKIDFDEISGKGKSMFMVSAIGTGVKIKQNEILKQENKLISNDNISLEQLKNAILKQELISLLKSNSTLEENHWEYLFNNPSNDVADFLLPLYIILRNKEFCSDAQTLFIRNVRTYFKLIDSNHAINLLYDNLQVDKIPKLELIKYSKLFSPNKIIELIEQDLKNTAIICLDIEKESYNKDELGLMMTIIDKLDQLPTTGTKELSKAVFSTKEKEAFVCENGHKNSASVEYCVSCGLNIYGLKEKEVNIIKEFKHKVEILDGLLK